MGGNGDPYPHLLGTHWQGDGCNPPHLLDLGPGQARPVAESSGHDWADELANLIAYHRNGNSVYMDGSHNPRPSEEQAAREFVERIRADERARNVRNYGGSVSVAAIEAEVRERMIPVHAHKGPDDTDRSILLEAAGRMERGYPPGGSNTTRAVAQLIRNVTGEGDT